LLIPKRHRRTDRQTDGRLTVALPRSALASRGKKPTTMMDPGQQLYWQQNTKWDYTCI